MKKFANNFSLLLVLCSIQFLFTQTAIAQPAARASDYQNNPVWIKMMEDPNVNYFEAVKAFDEYWKNHTMPEEEDEKMGKHNKYVESKEQSKAAYEEQEQKRIEAEAANKKITEVDLKEIEWKREMTYQVKRFKDWKRSIKPYIQNDGRILTEEERMKIYDQRQKELNKNKN